MPLFFSSIAVALLFLFPGSFALPHQAVNDLRPRQTASAPAGASSSTADQLIEDIERLNQTLTDLPEDAYNFLNEVGDKVEALESLFASLLGISTSASSSTPATPSPSASATRSVFNSSSPVLTPAIPTEPFLTILPILESLHFDSSHEFFGIFNSIHSNAQHHFNATGVFADSVEPHNAFPSAFSSDTDPLFGKRYDPSGVLASGVQRYNTFPGSCDPQSVLGKFHDSGGFLAGTVQRYYAFAGSQPIVGKHHDTTCFLASGVQHYSPFAAAYNSQSILGQRHDTAGFAHAFQHLYACGFTFNLQSDIGLVIPPYQAPTFSYNPLTPDSTSVGTVSYSSTFTPPVPSLAPFPSSSISQLPLIPVPSSSDEPFSDYPLPSLSLPSPSVNGSILHIPTRMPIPQSALSALNASLATRTANVSYATPIISTSLLSSLVTSVLGGSVTTVYLSTQTITTTVWVSPTPLASPPYRNSTTLFNPTGTS
ncbi:hypothetical protein IWZ03DRAFT_438062 [Phyllosticta citriasiana]|uniref:Uncharacterized protein n=1 Tax=Phyllosticta citriasiana TaxID=595635 RepID=A0ABR1KUP6_9PEZI